MILPIVSHAKSLIAGRSERNSARNVRCILDDSIRAGYSVTSAILLRWVARSRGYPGRRMALGQDTLLPIHLSQSSRHPRGWRIVSDVIATRDPRGKSYVTHFGFPARRHRVSFAPFYRIPTAGERNPPHAAFRDSHVRSRGWTGKGQRVGNLRCTYVARYTR